MTVQILASVESEMRRLLNKPSLKLTDFVDCVIGSSAGGLIALGLGCGKSANELQHIMGQIIGNTFKDRKSLFERITEPAYDAKNLETELIKHLQAD